MRSFLFLGVGAAAFLVLSGPAFAEGDATKGKAAYAKCAICHQVGASAQNTVGPELNKIVGRKAASVAGFAYSPEDALAIPQGTGFVSAAALGASSGFGGAAAPAEGSGTDSFCAGSRNFAMSSKTVLKK